jgi:hypothetical protein
MRSRINVVMMLAASFIVFIAVSSAKSVGCIYKGGEFGRGGQISAAVLLADGGGPMCIPHTACGYTHGVLGSDLHFTGGVLLTDGGGPMCIPGTACTSQLYSRWNLNYRSS